MNCEICGMKIKGQPYKTKIDNSVMITCKECSSYGKVQNAPQNNNQKRGKGKTRGRSNQNNRQQPRTYTKRPRDEYELIDNYEKVIRQAREKKHLTQKQLGEKLYERESVIAHIESGKMVPDTKTARKLEKSLNIKIIEKLESDEREFQDQRRFREATIGDIAKIKRS